MTDADVRERVTALEAMLEAAGDDPAVADVVQALVELYGEALARLIRGADPKTDELVSHLLIVHGIEPPTLLQMSPRPVHSGVA
jgi:hypothetical protein